ncbi:MAG TPA: hypothetical protein VNJ71_10780 [Gemmatimonadales bacterium]|nr:hypothetical protein [Gemmatimonadales bacterium]
MARPRRLSPSLHLALALSACAPATTAPDPAVIPAPGATPDSLIVRALHQSQLVTLGTADLEETDPFFGSAFQLGFREIWWHIRIRPDSVLKGNPAHASYVDYGPLGPALTPPIVPFPLAKGDFIVQRSTRWRTAPIEPGRQRVYFFRRCYNCAELPSRYSRGRTFASPWFAILTLPVEDWPRVRSWWAVLRKAAGAARTGPAFAGKAVAPFP